MKLGVLFGVWMLFVILMGIASTSFAVWVIIKIMQHFGVI